MSRDDYRQLENARPIVCGVYLLFHEQRLVYVGRAGDCHTRIAKHRTNGRAFDYALITPCPPTDAKWVEAELIAAFEPRQNRTRGETPKPAIVQPMPTAAPARDPLAVVSNPDAEQMAQRYGLHGPFRVAVRAGQVPHHAYERGGKTRREYRLVDVQDWIERTQRERLKGMGLLTE